MVNCRSRVVLKMSLLSGRRQFMFETDRCDFRHTCKRNSLDKNALMIDDTMNMNETDAEREMMRFIESKPEATLQADDPSLIPFEILIQFIARNRPYLGTRNGVWWDPHVLWALQQQKQQEETTQVRYPSLMNSSVPVSLSKEGPKSYFGTYYALQTRTNGWSYGRNAASFFRVR
jgi:hypothetical protein